MQPGGGNDAYWGNSVNSFSRTPTVPLGTGAPPPWRSGEYVPVSMLHTRSKVLLCSYFHLMKPYPPYGHFGQGGVNNTGSPGVAEPASNNPMNFSHPFPGTSAPQSQGAIPVWQLSHCWVNHETEGELHLTIVFRKFPSGEFMAL
jgi:hypothetical protein